MYPRKKLSYTEVEEDEQEEIKTEEDEQDSKDCFLERDFVREWKLLKSLINDIVSDGLLSNFSSAHKIRSIVLCLSVPPCDVLLVISSMLYIRN